MDFREVWQRVGDLEEQTFRTDRGEDFTYHFRKTYVVVSPGDISVPRTNFEKVFKRIQQRDTAGTPVQGQRFITAIFTGAGIVANKD